MQSDQNWAYFTDWWPVSQHRRSAADKWMVSGYICFQLNVMQLNIFHFNGGIFMADRFPTDSIHPAAGSPRFLSLRSTTTGQAAAQYWIMAMPFWLPILHEKLCIWSLCLQKEVVRHQKMGHSTHLTCCMPGQQIQIPGVQQLCLHVQTNYHWKQIESPFLQETKRDECPFKQNAELWLPLKEAKQLCSWQLAQFVPYFRAMMFDCWFKLRSKSKSSTHLLLEAWLHNLFFPARKSARILFSFSWLALSGHGGHQNKMQMEQTWNDTLLKGK